MPFIEINAAQIYFQAYGQDRPGKAPIVLIHGSTSTGQEDWALVAPLLAQHYRVIIPDCRGHGQSSNPRHSYSFKEMADDVAALVGALGYPRAHIIGHSNGGNVALVTLLEHPDIVQTAILQAANAFVSQDLIDREPSIFDPVRVQRERPGWVNDMIRLHGPTHGPDYWRDLLRLTGQAIISEPNYTPADLAKVTRPVLAIQGEKDTVNAPASHAQFIAEHTPQAELWLPAGVGHNVHLEVTLEWVRGVLDFLARRGTDVGEALDRLRRQQYCEDRETVFSVRAEDNGSGLRLSGQVLYESQRQAAIEAVQAALGPAHQEPNPAIQDDIRVLLTPETPWALLRRGVIDLRREPRSLSERLTQALLGEAVRILAVDGEWVWVRLEQDGYLGWILHNALYPCSAAEAQAYQTACNALVQAELAVVRDTPPGQPPLPDGKQPGKLPFGVKVVVVEVEEEWAEIRLPDGSPAWVKHCDLLPLDQRPHPDAAGIQQTLELVRRCTGVPYLWGGRTPFGYDCSGFAQAFHAFMDVHIPRDADQQFRSGLVVEGVPRPGDLIYFGEAAGRGLQRYGSVTHVAISLGGWKIIHANGNAWGISYDDIADENSPYSTWLREHTAGVRRFF